MLELNLIINMVSQVVRSNGPDDQKSRLWTDGKFLVSDLRGLIDRKLTISVSNPTVWLQLVPIKCIGFI